MCQVPFWPDFVSWTSFFLDLFLTYWALTVHGRSRDGALFCSYSFQRNIRYQWAAPLSNGWSQAALQSIVKRTSQQVRGGRDWCASAKSTLTTRTLRHNCTARCELQRILFHFSVECAINTSIFQKHHADFLSLHTRQLSYPIACSHKVLLIAKKIPKGREIALVDIGWSNSTVPTLSYECQAGRQ